MLDDPEFKPHEGGQRRPIQVQVPSKGDVFDIMVSAIQGPSDKPGALLTRKHINIFHICRSIYVYKCEIVNCVMGNLRNYWSHRQEVFWMTENIVVKVFTEKYGNYRKCVFQCDFCMSSTQYAFICVILYLLFSLWSYRTALTMVQKSKFNLFVTLMYQNCVEWLIYL